MIWHENSRPNILFKCCCKCSLHRSRYNVYLVHVCAASKKLNLWADDLPTLNSCTSSEYLLHLSSNPSIIVMPSVVIGSGMQYICKSMHVVFLVFLCGQITLDLNNITGIIASVPVRGILSKCPGANQLALRSIFAWFTQCEQNKLYIQLKCLMDCNAYMHHWIYLGHH